MNIKADTTNKPRKKSFISPKEFYRDLHPDLFSDTPPSTQPILTKIILEYHLDTLTSRNQEMAFQEFCRRLAKALICPNIKPQTGSTGGGDSKADASTYPVSPELAIRRYSGNPNSAIDKSWGFAFSCQRKWKSKARADIENLAESGRKFEKVYFITSQYARDK